MEPNVKQELVFEENARRAYERLWASESSAPFGFLDLRPHDSAVLDGTKKVNLKTFMEQTSALVQGNDGEVTHKEFTPASITSSDVRSTLEGVVPSDKKPNFSTLMEKCIEDMGKIVPDAPKGKHVVGLGFAETDKRRRSEDDLDVSSMHTRSGPSAEKAGLGNFSAAFANVPANESLKSWVASMDPELLEYLYDLISSSDDCGVEYMADIFLKEAALKTALMNELIDAKTTIANTKRDIEKAKREHELVVVAHDKALYERNLLMKSVRDLEGKVGKGDTRISQLEAENDKLKVEIALLRSKEHEQQIIDKFMCSEVVDEQILKQGKVAFEMGVRHTRWWLRRKGIDVPNDDIPFYVVGDYSGQDGDGGNDGKKSGNSS